MLGNASPEHRGGKERGAVLKSALAEHGEAREGAAVLEITSPEHRGGCERGAVLRAALAEHEEVRERAAVLGSALSEHGEVQEGAAVLGSALSEHGRDGKGPPYKRRPLGGKQGSGRTRGHGEKQKLRAN